MKRLGEIARTPDLLAALDQLEASRKARAKSPSGSPSGGASEPSGPVQGLGSPKTGGLVKSLAAARRSQALAEAKQLEGLAKKAGMDPTAAATLADGLRAQLPDGWTFVMLSPAQNGAVLRWLLDNSARPHMAVRLWARLFEVMRHDTGEVLATRADLAAHLGVVPTHVSLLMGELASINAIRRERQGRGVRYYMNSTVATHLPGAAARKAARDADGPLLTLMEGGQGRSLR